MDAGARRTRAARLLHRVRWISTLGVGLLLALLVVRGDRYLVFAPLLLAALLGLHVGTAAFLRRSLAAARARVANTSGGGGAAPQAGIASEVRSFLQRNSAPSDEPETIRVRYSASPTAPLVASVSMRECNSLWTHLGRRGLRPATDALARQSLLVAGALASDVDVLEGCFRRASVAGDLLDGFASLRLELGPWLPILRHLQRRDGAVDDPSGIERAIATAREQHRQVAFEADMATRVSGGCDAVTLESVDALTGVPFQLLVRMIYEARGYTIEETPISGDQGADVVAVRGGERVVVQVKHTQSPADGGLSNKAVQEAVAALKHYRAARGLVVTNYAHFTPSAVQLATSNGIELVDRQRLGEWLREFNRLPKDQRRLQSLWAPSPTDAEDAGAG